MTTTTATTKTAPCGCTFTGRIIDSWNCTVIDHDTITGRQRNRHFDRALKAMKAAR